MFCQAHDETKMKNRVSILLTQIKNEIETIFHGLVQDNFTNVKKSNLGGVLSKCYQCGGAGFVANKSRLDEHLPSRFGERQDSYPYSTCPVCKGTGHIGT